MTTIVPHIGIRISGIQSLEVAKVTIKNGGSIAFIFDQKNPKYIEPAKANKISETISTTLGQKLVYDQKMVSTHVEVNFEEEEKKIFLYFTYNLT